VPELSRFFGIGIRLHYADHNPPHFHATYPGRTVEIDIQTLAILHGAVATSWHRAATGEPIVRIEPLS
jgi:hypothetical protein